MELLKNELPRGFTIVCLDESFFIYDSLVRRVWIEEGSRPVVTVTGSPAKPDLEACWELGALLAAEIAG